MHLEKRGSQKTIIDQKSKTKNLTKNLTKILTKILTKTLTKILTKTLRKTLTKIQIRIRDLKLKMIARASMTMIATNSVDTKPRQRRRKAN
jgi:hypothetical protein